MKLATLTPEGWPYIVPVWYEYDGEAFSALGRPKSRWVAHIENDSRASICVDTTEAPYKRVIVQGNAKIADMQFTGDWERRWDTAITRIRNIFLECLCASSLTILPHGLAQAGIPGTRSELERQRHL